MIKSILGAIVALAISAPLAAQTYAAAGTFKTVEAFHEPLLAAFRKPIGNPADPADQIVCHITGPAATSPGTSIMSPVAPYASGWPVLVMFPGFDVAPALYDGFASFLAGYGYIVIVVDSNDSTVGVPMDLNEATANGITLEDILQRATLQKRVAGVFSTSHIHGKFDKTKIACGGHSLGGGLAHSMTGPYPGGNPLWVTYGTPDYVARVTWAPWGGSGVIGSGPNVGQGGHYKSSATGFLHRGAESALPGLIIVGNDDNGASGVDVFTEDAWDWLAQIETWDNYTDQNLLLELAYDPLDQPTLKVGHNEPVYDYGATTPGSTKVFITSLLAAYGYLEAQLYDRNLYLSNTCGPSARWNPCVSKVSGRFKQVRSCQYGTGATRAFLTFQDISDSIAPNPIGGAWCYTSLTLIAPYSLPGGVGLWELSGPTTIGTPYSYDHRATHGATTGWPYVLTPSLYHPGVGPIYMQIIGTVKPVAPLNYTLGVSQPFPFIY